MRSDIAETIRCWQAQGVRPSEVWESVMGEAPVRLPVWAEVAALLEARAAGWPDRIGSAQLVPAKVRRGRVVKPAHVVRRVDGVSWRAAA